MKRFISLFFLFLNTFCFSQDTTIQSKIKYYSEKVDKYLDKEKALSSYYLIDKIGIKMYASSQDKLSRKIEFSILWSQIDNFNNLFTFYSSEAILNIYKQGEFKGVPESLSIKPKKIGDEKKLSGFKIAIDAGHTAGNIEMGKIEKKHLTLKKDSLHGVPDSIEIAEGMLTFATAKLLKEKLETDGAEVFLTRKENGSTAFGKSFEQWLKDDYKKAIDSLYNKGKFSAEKKKWYLSPKCKDNVKFTLIFKDLELAKRAEIINNYKPDFTIIIHFNVDETNTGWTKPGNKDLDMTFIGGAFMRKDLSSEERRFEFLRLLISDDLEKSIKLSGAMVSSFEKILKVNSATIKDAKYLREGCLSTSENGVFCRNLQLTRYIHSPLVYGETLYQDNIAECKLLNKECDKTKNERIQQVSEAYFQGILAYVKSLQTQ